MNDTGFKSSVKRIITLAQWGVVFICTAALIIVILLAFFNHPSIDDYAYAQMIRESGFIESQHFWYNQWSGRYTSNLLLSLNPIVWGSFTGYKVLTSLIIVLFFGAFFRFLYKFFSQHLSGKEVLFAFCALSLVFLLGLPTLSQGYFWMAATLTYQIPALFTIVFLTIAHQLFYKPASGFHKVKTIASCLVLAAIAGSNELSVIGFIIFLPVAFIARLIYHKRVSSLLLTWLVIVISGIAILAFAPGNQVRSGDFAHESVFLTLLANTAWSTGSFFLRNLPLMLVLTAMLLPVLIKFTRSYTQPGIKPPFYLHPLLSLALTASLIGSQFFAGWWTTCAHLPARSENVVFFSLLLGWTWFLCNSCHLIIKKFKKPEFWAGWLMILAFPLFLLLLVRENNIRAASGDIILGRAAGYNNELHTRYNTLENCTSDTCSVHTIQNRPIILFVSDINDPQFSYQYKMYCKFFNKNRIVVK